MAVQRDIPYSQFNYLVDLGDGTDGPKAGFQEVTGLGMEINVAEYRRGNAEENVTTKVTGTYKVPDITLKRGVIAFLDLNNWLDLVRQGKQGDDVNKTVIIHLRNEERSENVLTWKLLRARPIKYTGPSFNAKGTDVAVEEIVLACENIVMETG
jgi:phage tail-like protein